MNIINIGDNPNSAGSVDCTTSPNSNRPPWSNPDIHVYSGFEPILVDARRDRIISQSFDFTM